MARPIWQDFIVDLGAPVSTPGVPFYIYCSDTDETIFQGVSYPAPGKSNASVRVNDIVADYILSLDPSTINLDYFAIGVSVFSTASGEPVQKGEEYFWNDWSYDGGIDPWAQKINCPITSRFVPGQFLLVTAPQNIEIYDATFYDAAGDYVGYVTPGYPDDAGLMTDAYADFFRDTQFFSNTKVCVTWDYPDAEKVEIGSDLGTHTYTRAENCPRYVLYYRNAYGAWDSLPVEGKTVQYDNLTRYNSERDYNTARPSSRGKRNYVNEIRRSYEFWTGWLTEAQSLLMHHLLNSTAVYLHDIEEGTVRSLVLTGSKTEYKHGRPGLFAYRIEADLAQGRMRR